MRKIIKKLIFTPLDPRWDEFTTVLSFHLNVHDDYDGFPVSNCDGSFKYIKNILENRYPEINIEKTIEYFKTSHCFCDCDVFFEWPCGLGIEQNDCAPRINIDAKVK